MNQMNGYNKLDSYYINNYRDGFKVIKYMKPITGVLKIKKKIEPQNTNKIYDNSS